MIRRLVTNREVLSKTWRLDYPDHCPVRLRDGDGINVGACHHYLHNGICPDHGQIYQGTFKKDEKMNKKRNLLHSPYFCFQIESCFLRWTTGFMECIDGLTKILTLGIYCPELTMTFVFWSSKQQCQRRIKKDQRKKYELTNETKSIDNIVLHRIRALKDFGNVCKGDLGGWIEKEFNLSQDRNCWVYDDAEVSGDAKVFGNAQVYGHARVFEYAWVFGNAQVFEHAWVFGDAEVFGNAWVCGNAWVYNNAVVYGDAHVFGNVKVCNGVWNA